MSLAKLLEAILWIKRTIDSITKLIEERKDRNALKDAETKGDQRNLDSRLGDGSSSPTRYRYSGLFIRSAKRIGDVEHRPSELSPLPEDQRGSGGGASDTDEFRDD